MENPGFDPPVYEESEHRDIRPSVASAFGHDTLDRVPNIDFYRNAGSVSGHRAVRPSLQELHDVFQKVGFPHAPTPTHSAGSLYNTTPKKEVYDWRQTVLGCLSSGLGNENIYKAVRYLWPILVFPCLLCFICVHTGWWIIHNGYSQLKFVISIKPIDSHILMTLLWNNLW